MKPAQRLRNLLLIILLGLAAASTPPLANAEDTITIYPDGSVSPADAPVTQNGNIYKLTSNINKPIQIQRNNTLFHGQGYTIQGITQSEGLILSGTKNVTVKNAKISSFLTGIKLGPSADNTIMNTSITNCTYGILAHSSLEANIINNTIHSNKWDGIFITASPNSQVTNNKVESNGKWGIYLGYSTDCTLRNNQMNRNKYNFGVAVDFIQDIDTSNTINGKPVIFWVNKQNSQVPADAGYLALVDSHNIEARNLHLTDNGQGITLANSGNIHIENCNVTGNSYYGIALIDSSYNTLSNNTVTRNDGAGITLVTSTSNSITNNTIEGNNTGIYLQNADDNNIHHNNLINNTRQAVNENSKNTWDDGYPSGGNYWSNYEGKDANNDGIGDTPYIIDNDNQDKYPLMNAVRKMPLSSRNPLEFITPFLIVTLMIIMITAASAGFYKTRKARNEFRQAPQHSN